MTFRRTLLIAGAAAASLLVAAPAAAQVPPAPPEVCGALSTVGSTVGSVQDTAEGAAGQQAPADVEGTVGTVRYTAGCPSASDDGTVSTTSTTAYRSGTAVLSASSGTLPRTGGPAPIAGLGAAAAAAAAVASVARRRLG